jgi:DNA-binding MarR family transcriptional regulator
MEQNETPDSGARELELLEALEENPTARQIDLATRMGVAVGTVNWLLKRLVGKGYVKAKRIGRWQWRYLLTPRGIARKARLTQSYVKASMEQYRKTRSEALELIGRIRHGGYDRVCILGDSSNDLLDVCRLTCVEQKLKVVGGRGSEDRRSPVLHVVGRELGLEMPEETPDGTTDR